MSRFTYKNEDGYYIDGTNGKSSSDIHGRIYGKAIDKLAEYEELEEQGKLFKTPLKLGSTVYVVGTKCLAGSVPEVECAAIIDCDECKFNKEYIVFEKEVDDILLFFLMFDGSDNYILNETVFETKEEGNDRLKILKNERSE